MQIACKLQCVTSFMTSNEYYKILKLIMEMKIVFNFIYCIYVRSCERQYNLESFQVIIYYKNFYYFCQWCFFFLSSRYLLKHRTQFVLGASGHSCFREFKHSAHHNEGNGQKRRHLTYAAVITSTTLVSIGVYHYVGGIHCILFYWWLSNSMEHSPFLWG